MWDLDISRDHGKTWKTVARKPSCEACKSMARAYHQSPLNTGLHYRIYALDGQQLHSFSSNNDCWRMKWQWGDQRPRVSQDIEEVS